MPMGFVGKNDGDIKLLLPNQQQWRWVGGDCVARGVSATQ
jgi:hypothetical protein